MHQLPIKNYWQLIRPTIFNVVFCAVLTLLLVVIPVLPTFLEEHQLLGVGDAILPRLNESIGNVLVSIDNMEFSATIVTFLFWGMVGLLMYVIIMTVVRFWQRAEAFKELASNEYVHPTGFSANFYWRTLVLKEGVNILLLIALTACISGTLFFLLPVATVHARAVVLGWSWSGLLTSAAAALLLWAGVVGITFCIKAWHYRHLLRAED